MNENLTVLSNLKVDIATLVDDNGQIRAHYMNPKSTIWPIHDYKVIQNRYVCGPDGSGGIMTISASPDDHSEILEVVHQYFAQKGVELTFCE